MAVQCTFLISSFSYCLECLQAKFIKVFDCLVSWVSTNKPYKTVTAASVYLELHFYFLFRWKREREVSYSQLKQALCKFLSSTGEATQSCHIKNLEIISASLPRQMKHSFCTHDSPLPLNFVIDQSCALFVIIQVTLGLIRKRWMGRGWWEGDAEGLRKTS